MAYTIFISDDAKADLVAIGDFYTEKSDQLRKNIFIQISNSINKLSKKPLLHQKRYKDIRICHTNKYPFGIHFLVEENSVFVLRILHHRQCYG